MKIEKLLEYETAIKNVKQKKIASRKIDFDVENAGKSSSGSFASVYSSGNDPHVVNRVERRPSKNNNYKKFAEWLVSTEQARSNPHFPKIYVIKQYSDKAGNQRGEYRIEKLTPTSELNDHELEAILYTSFEKINDNIKPYSPLQHITYAMYYYVIGEHYSYVPTGKLRQALDMLAKLEKEFNLGRDFLDIGANNTMVRRTPSGSQLVITDPFYG